MGFALEEKRCRLAYVWRLIRDKKETVATFKQNRGSFLTYQMECQFESNKHFSGRKDPISISNEK